MKKLHIFTAILPLFFLFQNANAANDNVNDNSFQNSHSNVSVDDKFYVGVDGIYSKTDHKYKTTYGDSVASSYQNRGRHGEHLGFGINAGYKMQYDRVFVAPEVFYDNLNNSTNDFGGAPTTLNVDNRYGVKVNLGYDLTSNVSAFVNLGLANVRYINRDPTTGTSSGYNKLAPIYGIGALYKLNNNWALKAAYDYQKFSTRYYSSAPLIKDQLTLRVFKLGVIYNF
jgi:opacity protein-like surface antigen